MRDCVAERCIILHLRSFLSAAFEQLDYIRLFRHFSSRWMGLRTGRHTEVTEHLTASLTVKFEVKVQALINFLLYVFTCNAHSLWTVNLRGAFRWLFSYRVGFLFHRLSSIFIHFVYLQCSEKSQFFFSFYGRLLMWFSGLKVKHGLCLSSLLWLEPVMWVWCMGCGKVTSLFVA